MACGLAAPDADRPEFYDFVREGQEAGHGAERFATEVLVEAGQDDMNTPIGQGDSEVREGLVEELGLFHCDQVGLGLDSGCEFFHRFDGDGLVGRSHVGCEHDLVVAVVKGVFEDLDLALGEEGSPDEADKFLGLASEHGAADDGDDAISLGPHGPMVAARGWQASGLACQWCAYNDVAVSKETSGRC